MELQGALLGACTLCVTSSSPHPLSLLDEVTRTPLYPPRRVCSHAIVSPRDEIISALLSPPRRCYFRSIVSLETAAADTQVIVHEACHEANAGPWYKLAERCGATVRVWRVDPATFESRPADLAALLGPATKLVAVVHVSNILGEVLRLGCRF